MKARVGIAVALMAVLAAACTPQYVKQETKAAAKQARLVDSVDVERSTNALLSRQGQVCLLSASGGTEAGAALLQSMQAGLSGYFLAVGVDGESIDYLSAVASDPCPGASYLFYVQPVDPPQCSHDSSGKQHCDIGTQFVITVISAADHSLVDRVTFSIRNSFLPSFKSDSARRRQAFEQLGVALTGANAH